jgi:hypothetical protein
MRITPDRNRENLSDFLNVFLYLSLLAAVLLLMESCATSGTMNQSPESLPLLENWSGDYPVAELGKLPSGQHDTSTGYIGDTDTFITVWRYFMPNENTPAVDFSKNIVVFSRNINFYNRTSILKVELRDGIAEIIAMETMSAIPIEEKVAMAMAVVPRDGIRAIRSGTGKIRVMDYK